MAAMTAPIAHRSAQPRGSVQHGDAFDLIEQLAPDSVDLIISSPPYWGLRSYGAEAPDDILDKWCATGCTAERVPPHGWYRDAGGVLGLEPYPEWYIAHLVEFFNRAARTLRSTGSLWLNIGDTYFARWASIRDGGGQGFKAARQRRRTPSGGYRQDKQLLLIPARFAIAMQTAGWILRNDLIWSKPQVMPRPESDRLRLSHEHWLHFVARQPRARARYYYDLTGCEAGARDVVVCPTSPGSDGHYATFPPELVRPRILSTSPADGMVLDPFCGTGRAVVEAVRLGRRGLGFEISGSHAASAQRNVLRALIEPDRSSS